MEICGAESCVASQRPLFFSLPAIFSGAGFLDYSGSKASWFSTQAAACCSWAAWRSSLIRPHFKLCQYWHCITQNNTHCVMQWFMVIVLRCTLECFTARKLFFFDDYMKINRHCLMTFRSSLWGFFMDFQPKNGRAGEARAPGQTAKNFSRGGPKLKPIMML